MPALGYDDYCPAGRSGTTTPRAGNRHQSSPSLQSTISCILDLFNSFVFYLPESSHCRCTATCGSIGCPAHTTGTAARSRHRDPLAASPPLQLGVIASMLSPQSPVRSCIITPPGHLTAALLLLAFFVPPWPAQYFGTLLATVASSTSLALFLLPWPAHHLWRSLWSFFSALLIGGGPDFRPSSLMVRCTTLLWPSFVIPGPVGPRPGGG